MERARKQVRRQLHAPLTSRVRGFPSPEVFHLFTFKKIVTSKFPIFIVLQLSFIFTSNGCPYLQPRKLVLPLLPPREVAAAREGAEIEAAQLRASVRRAGGRNDLSTSPL